MKKTENEIIDEAMEYNPGRVFVGFSGGRDTNGTGLGPLPVLMGSVFGPAATVPFIVGNAQPTGRKTNDPSNHADLAERGEHFRRRTPQAPRSNGWAKVLNCCERR